MTKTSTSDNDEFNHRYSYAVKTKPIKAIQAMISSLSPHGEIRTLTKNKTYRINEEADGEGVIIILDGIATVTNTESGHYLYTTYPPSILGFIHSYSLYYNLPNMTRHSILAETDVNYIFISLQKFVDVMDETNGWHDVARILAHRLMLASSKDVEFIDGNAYKMMRSLIQEVWLYPEEYRAQINLPNFIKKRTGLSRTRIMTILTDLKEGGYITVENGKLISVIKLPSAY